MRRDTYIAAPGRQSGVRSPNGHVIHSIVCLTRTPANSYGALIPTTPNSVVTKVPIFGYLHDTFRKRVGFRWILVYNLQKISTNTIFSSRVRGRILVLPRHQIECTNTERCKSVYDSKYLVSPCFLLGPIILLIINKLDNLGMTSCVSRVL